MRSSFSFTFVALFAKSVRRIEPFYVLVIIGVSYRGLVATRTLKRRDNIFFQTFIAVSFGGFAKWNISFAKFALNELFVSFTTLRAFFGKFPTLRFEIIEFAAGYLERFSALHTRAPVHDFRSAFTAITVAAHELHVVFFVVGVAHFFAATRAGILFDNVIAALTTNFTL